MLDSWKRPSELYAGSGTIIPEEGAVFDLAQDVITDCSVVASLCSAITREERSFGKVLSLYINLLHWGKHWRKHPPLRDLDLMNLTDVRLYQISYIRKIHTVIQKSAHPADIR